MVDHTTVLIILIVFLGALNLLYKRMIRRSMRVITNLILTEKSMRTLAARVNQTNDDCLKTARKTITANRALTEDLRNMIINEQERRN